MLELEQLEDRSLPSPLIQLEVGNVPDFTDFGRVLTGQYDPLLFAWGVGAQQYVGTVRLPDTSITSNDQLIGLIKQEVDAGIVKPGEDVLVYLPRPIDPAYGGWHSWFYYGGQTYNYGVAWGETPNMPMMYWTIVGSHEDAEMLADEAGANEEICDPVENQPPFLCGGYYVAQFISPSSSSSTSGNTNTNPPSLLDELVTLYDDWIAMEIDSFEGNFPGLLGDWQRLDHDVAVLESMF